jgi:hypothetical protein
MAHFMVHNLAQVMVQVTTIPVKRHRAIDRITANAICKQADLLPKF